MITYKSELNLTSLKLHCQALAFFFLYSTLGYQKRGGNANNQKEEYCLRFIRHRGTWVAQLVEHLTSAQVIISQLVCSSPALGFVLTAQSLEPVSDSVSPSLYDPPRSCSVSLSQK